MSLWVTGTVAAAYAASVIGVHRATVYHRRRVAQFYPSLRWLDWGTLLEGLMPPTAQRSVVSPLEGGPSFEISGDPSLGALVRGERAHDSWAGFSGGEGRWLDLLARVRTAPQQVLAELVKAQPASVAEAYLREWLTFETLSSPFNLELQTFTSKRRINDSLTRFGEHPSLFFVRARASSLLGFNRAVLDDLARAVYFSRNARFYVSAVTSLSFVEDQRPALMLACREAERRNAGIQP